MWCGFSFTEKMVLLVQSLMTSFKSGHIGSSPWPKESTRMVKNRRGIWLNITAGIQLIIMNYLLLSTRSTYLYNHCNNTNGATLSFLFFYVVLLLHLYIYPWFNVFYMILGVQKQTASST